MQLILRAVGGLCLLAATAAIWGVSAAANFAHAKHMAGSSEWALVIAAASVASDVLKAGSPILLFMSLRNRLWLPAFAALMIWMPSALWSARAGAGFISITFADATAERRIDATMNSSASDQLEAETRHLAWLQGQIVKATGREEIRLNREIDSSRATIAALRENLSNDGRRVLSADPVADFLRDVLGLEPRVVSASTMLMFLVLVEVGSNFMPLAFSVILMPPPPPRPTKKRHRTRTRNTRSAPATSTASAPAGPRLVVNNSLPEVSLRDRRSHAIQFLKALTAQHGAARTIPVSEIRAAYSGFCRRQGVREMEWSLLVDWLSGLGCSIRRRNGSFASCTLPLKEVA